MSFDVWRKRSAVIAAGAWSLLEPAAFTQTRIDLRTQTKSVDFSNASATKPARIGPSLPPSCGQGEFFFLTTAPAGQNVYGCSSPNTWALEGSAVPQASLVPSTFNNAGKLLTTDGANPVWQGIGGDVTGTLSALSVGALQGRPLSPSPPADGQLLKYNGVSGVWEAVALNGDLTGPPAATVVTKLQGRALSNATPANGQLLKFNSTTNSWEPVAIGGDVTGAPATLTVSALQGRALSQLPPGDNQLLKYNASTTQWESVAIGGDISGTPAALTVSALQGRNVASTAPSAGQALLWNGNTNSWSPATIQSPVNYGGAFSNATSVTIPATQHGLNTPNLIVTCYDNAVPANVIEPSYVTVDPATFNVTINFAVPQSGRCVVNGSGGTGSGGSSTSGAGMASQLGDLNVVRTSSAVLNIGANCSNANPCNVRFGTVTRSFVNSATLTVAAGTGPVFIYVANDGTLNAGTSALTLACSSGCQVRTGVTQFPADALPVFTWTAVTGAWLSGGGLDQRSFLSAKSVAAGLGIAIADNGLTSTINVDSTVVPTYVTATATLAWGTINNGACGAEQFLSVPGAFPGDGVAPGWPALSAGLLGTMRVSAIDTVAVKICNLSGVAASIPALVYRATVVRGS